MGLLIDKTLLKWREPAEAWRAITGRQFLKNSFIIDLAKWFIISMLVMLCFAIFKRYPYGTPFTPVQVVIASIFMAVCVAGVNRRVMLSPSTIKITENGIARTKRDSYFSDNTLREYKNIKSYHFDTIQGDSKAFKILVLCSHNDEFWKIGLDDSTDIPALELILADRGIHKS